MEIGFIGLGRMGGNMVRRLSRGGHQCRIFANNEATRAALATETGAIASGSLNELVGALAAPRVLWMMVPEGQATTSVTDELAATCEAGDIVIDGGNSNFKQSVARAAQFAARGIHFVDCGTSGGVWGLERGYSLMLGGEAEVIGRIAPLLDTLAPGVAAAPRLPQHEGNALAAGEQGWLHCGPAGAGHYVKMIHNGIEYGIMQAMAEGMLLLNSTSQEHIAADYRYDFDLAAIAEVWRRGSVVSSWLLDLGAQALAEDASLHGYSPAVSDSGEGRWTIEAAIDQRVSVQVLAAALFNRFASRDEGQFGNRFLSALRNKFGGHPSLTS